MPLTKELIEDKIEIVTVYKHIQVRTATVIKEDDKEISRTFRRKVLTPGWLKGGTGSDKNDLVETDLSGEDPDVQAICNTAWTSQVKNDWKDWLITNPPP